jgi:hypothetical protein
VEPVPVVPVPVVPVVDPVPVVEPLPIDEPEPIPLVSVPVPIPLPVPVVEPGVVDDVPGVDVVVPLFGIVVLGVDVVVV